MHNFVFECQQHSCFRHNFRFNITDKNSFAALKVFTQSIEPRSSATCGYRARGLPAGAPSGDAAGAWEFWRRERLRGGDGSPASDGVAESGFLVFMIGSHKTQRDVVAHRRAVQRDAARMRSAFSTYRKDPCLGGHRSGSATLPSAPPAQEQSRLPVV